MSAKSRKRNRRLAALAGLAGAVALANRKPKQSDVSQDSGRGSGLRPTVDTAKKDTAKKSDSKMPDNISKDMGKNNKPVKKTTLKPFRTFDLGVPDGSRPLKLKDNSIRATNRETNAAGIKEPNKPMIASIFPKSKTADNYAGDMRDFGKTNYKSGGRVKGCGKALRGYGKAMKGKR